jgi:transposase
MGRRQYGQEFKVEAVRLVRERGVSVAHAARDLDLHPNLLRNWVKAYAADPALYRGTVMRQAAAPVTLPS